MDTLLAEYMVRFDTSKAPQKTRQNATQAFAHFQRFLDETGIEAGEAAEEDIAAFVVGMQKSLADSTVKLYLGQVRAAYKQAVKRGRITSNPTTDIALPSAVDSAPRVFSIAELNAIRASIETTREAIVFFGLAYTGLRKDELRNLRRSDTDFAAAQITVIGKQRKLRHVPLHPLLTDALGPHFARENDFALPARSGKAPISASTFDRTLYGLLARAGVSGHAHDFRKTVATTLSELDVREAVIDKIMGWAPRTVRDRYYTRIADKDMHDAILRLYPLAKQRRQRRPVRSTKTRERRAVTAPTVEPPKPPATYPPLRLIHSA